MRLDLSSLRRVRDRKSTRLNSSHPSTSYAVFCLKKKIGDDVGDEVVEVDADPARLDALAPAGDLARELVRALEVDAEQVVAVGAGARAASAGLDAEEVVEDRDDEVVVQVATVVAVDDEGDDGQAFGFFFY